ncbi:beta-1,4-N-acetylgalactosaminyltransferase bre-4-like [Choristoneura fumiferana]|uniref:beta-1,4-N-acetylgalactosaminyltransferase bre-4-like n=1 Tax=Choristoneura fumiferana TaxID=7141 RepID=UPI003D158E64
MKKWCAIRRCLQIRLSVYIVIALCLLSIVHFFTFYGYYNYTHINRDSIDSKLYKKVHPAVLKRRKQNCTYESILQRTASMQTWDIGNDTENFVAAGIDGGSYVPPQCNPLFSVAVLVTYRNRQKQLDIFLPYMHNFLRKQNIHYKIYLIEQQDEKPWNKGLLYNIGARQAIADKFPCLILQDVDLLPLDESNLYVCTTEPRHLSASVDKFRFVLPYDWLVGGVFAIRSDQYKEVNGFSNRFLGWGGEDDDFYSRLSMHDMKISRFPRSMSRYTMLAHRPEAKNAARLRILADNARRGRAGAAADGLRAAAPRHLQVRPHRLFTLIAVYL